MPSNLVATVKITNDTLRLLKAAAGKMNKKSYNDVIFELLKRYLGEDMVKQILSEKKVKVI